MFFRNDKKKYIVISCIYHLCLLSLLIFSYQPTAPLAVIENTNQQDVISAVILGDSTKSKILPQIDSALPRIEPLPKQTPQTQAPVKMDANPEESIALRLEKKKQRQAEIDKALAKKMRQQLSAKHLLTDIKKTHHKQQKINKKNLQNHFAQLLKEQAEESLRQQLHVEDIKLQGQETRMAQGEVNKYKALMMQAISEQWLVPSGVNPNLVTELLIRLARSGAVLEVQITKSSGDATLDSSARAAVLKASPLPVPQELAAFTPFRQFILKANPKNLITR